MKIVLVFLLSLTIGLVLSSPTWAHGGGIARGAAADLEHGRGNSPGIAKGHGKAGPFLRCSCASHFPLTAGVKKTAGRLS